MYSIRSLVSFKGANEEAIVINNLLVVTRYFVYNPNEKSAKATNSQRSWILKTFGVHEPES